MPLGLPRLLLISAALHLALLTAFFCHLRAHHGPSSLSDGRMPQITLIYTLHNETVSDRLVGSGNFAPDPNPDGTSAPPLPSSTAGSAADAAAPSFALKDSAHAHVRWPSESPLSPASAPRVKGGDGLVFIMDVSGSMYEPYAGTTRLALARQVLAQRIRALPDGAPFALVVYGERAQSSGPLVRASDATREAAVAFLNREYDLGGGTNLPAGLELAAGLDIGAVVLASDGDLNTTEAELFPQVRRLLGPASDCPALTVIGIAPRPDTGDRAILRDLADHQHGTYLVRGNDGDPGLLTSAKPSPGP